MSTQELDGGVGGTSGDESSVWTEFGDSACVLVCGDEFRIVNWYVHASSYVVLDINNIQRRFD